MAASRLPLSRGAAERIASLGLRPHPEGGFYREIHRSSLSVTDDARGVVRSAVTQIWFLLAAGEVSRWHRAAGDELWQFVAGEPLVLYHLDERAGVVVERRLGPLPAAGEPLPELAPLACVPGGEWQAARALGAYALVTCVVAPGFEFDDFAFAVDHPESAARLVALRPDLAELL